MNPLMNDVDRVLVGRNELQARIAELGAQITADYQGKELVLVCVLKGAALFFADLFRHIEMPVSCDFISISSYGASTKSSGVVRLIKDVDNSVFEKHILIVEDIVDSGLTLNYLKGNFATRGAKSVKVCTLLDKPERRKVELKPDYCGFVIPNEFVVGYGLDYAEQYRALPEVYVLSPKVYS